MTARRFAWLLLASVGVPPLGAQGAPPPVGTVQRWMDADIYGGVNPETLALVGSFQARKILGVDSGRGIVSSQLQGTCFVGASPSYGLAGVQGEWMPTAWLQLRARLEGDRFFGANGNLLSFDSPQAPYGRQDLRALEGREESTNGARAMLQVVLRLPLGPGLLRLQQETSRLWFGGRGPYTLNWEYDTLVQNGGNVHFSRAQYLLSLPGRDRWLAGPYGEHVRSPGTNLQRSRVGLSTFWDSSRTFGRWGRPRVGVQAGVDLHDRNRAGQAYLEFNLGTSWGGQ
jgi:hypothetical protein